MKARTCPEVNREIAKYVDVMIGNEEDFACLGYEVEGVDHNLSKLDPSAFKSMIEKVVADYPEQAVATTLREYKAPRLTAGLRWFGTKGEFHQATNRDLWIFDRVGGGDSFASGLIYGFLTDQGALKAVEYGAAHGALAMTTPGTILLWPVWPK